MEDFLLSLRDNGCKQPLPPEQTIFFASLRGLAPLRQSQKSEFVIPLCRLLRRKSLAFCRSAGEPGFQEEQQQAAKDQPLPGSLAGFQFPRLQLSFFVVARFFAARGFGERNANRRKLVQFERAGSTLERIEVRRKETLARPRGCRPGHFIDTRIVGEDEFA